MSDRIRFKSLQDTMVYVRDSDGWRYSNRPMQVNMEYSMYDAMGDGMTQHTSLSWIPEERFTDFYASFAAHLLEHPEDMEQAENCWYHHDNAEQVRFAMKVKYREDKRQWYSLTFEKTSTSEKKQYDTRWHEVPDWADGSPEAVFRLLHGDIQDLTFRLIYYQNILKTMKYETGCYHGSCEMYVFPEMNMQDQTLAWQVFLSVQMLVVAQRNLRNARRNFETYTENKANWDSQQNAA